MTKHLNSRQLDSGRIGQHVTCDSIDASTDKFVAVTANI